MEVSISLLEPKGFVHPFVQFTGKAVSKDLTTSQLQMQDSIVGLVAIGL